MWINFSPNKKTTSKSKSLRPPVCYRWPKPSQQLSPFHRPAITLFNLDLHSTKKQSFEIPSYIPIKWVESHQFHVTASHIETPGFVAIFQQPPAPPSSQAALPMSRSREVAHRWQPHFIGCHCCHGESQQKTQLAQHTTPIAKTHRTATLFASESTEKLKMFINIHHRNITIPSPKHHRSIATHHWDTKASPTQSRDITNTKPRHHPHITKTSQHNHYTSPRHARDITDTSLKDHQNITSTCRKHLDTSPKNHWNIPKISPNHPWKTNKT